VGGDVTDRARTEAAGHTRTDDEQATTASPDRQTRARIGEALFGLALVTAGGLLIADRLGWVDVDVWAVASSLWPLILVVPGIGLLLDRRWGEGILLTLIGLVLLGGTTGAVPEFGLGVIVPIVLVAVGITALGDALRRRSRSDR